MGEDDRGRVLVIDDDDSFRFALRKALRRSGFDVLEADGGRAALEVLGSGAAPDAALLDLKMADVGGLEVLRRASGTSTRIVVLTGHGSVGAAVEAMKLGAFSFLEKPVDGDLLAPLLDQAIAEARGGHGQGTSDFAPPLVGTSAAMDAVRRFVAQVGPTDATVAIYGETGTGKEVVARRLHVASPRREGPFVALNAATVPRELFESELFGHKRGAFTGASVERAGLFRDADGGTLFIDELAELPLESQAKLLRALETRTIRPVGESAEVPVDVRIIAATNRHLNDEVREGRFREDLYFRLQVFPIVLPPLRDRSDDVAPMAEHLLTRLGGPKRTLTPDALEALRGHGWPGNVRELLNVLRRASLFAQGDVLDGPLVRRMLAASIFAQPRALTPSPPPPRAQEDAQPMRLADVERAHIEQTLDRHDGNITHTAASLGIDRRTLQRKLRSYGIGDG
jgi:DNA-binding NtrC family response regulator